MDIPSYKCLECGLPSRWGEIHKMSCSSRQLMTSYVRVLEELRKFPDDMLGKLSFTVYCETLERKMALHEMTEATTSLGLYNEM